ncbi:MAG: chromosomal replication initiator DnaA [Pseudomonadota bacterium]
MSEQLILPLPLETAFERVDFFVSDPNSAAVATLEAWANWPLGKLVLCGPAGSGKSHLVRIWASETGGRVVAARGLAAANPMVLSAAPLAVEDVPDAAPEDEVALFHIHNLAAADGQPLLMTGQGAPGRWPLTLPDLESRIAAASVATLGAPDDALLSAVLIKLFADRQLAVPEVVIDWMLPRIERSFSFAQAYVAQVDAAALRDQARVTVPLARRALATMEGDL